MLFIVHVAARVKPDCVDAFRAATIENARNSVNEPGVARFDVLQQADDPARFVLMEAYRSPEAAAEHKQTRHYQVWRDTVADMMVEARTSTRYANVFPPDGDW
ncbi:MAG TPA: putative quinol monooxygenase [Vicinamibacterales bacterium]|nr:putative quinol monooxygenase [Vicinamibacterales bacterium]